MKLTHKVAIFTLFVLAPGLIATQEVSAASADHGPNGIPKTCIMSGVIARTMVEKKDAEDNNSAKTYYDYLINQHNYDDKTARSIVGLARGMAGMVDKIAKADIGNLNKDSVYSISMFMCDAGSKRTSSPELLDYLISNSLTCQRENQNNVDHCILESYQKYGH